MVIYKEYWSHFFISTIGSYFCLLISCSVNMLWDNYWLNYSFFLWKFTNSRVCTFASQIHASQTENFLNGRSLLETDLAKQAAAVLSTELEPDSQPQDASPEYRSSVAEALLYKVIQWLLSWWDSVQHMYVSLISFILQDISLVTKIFSLSLVS